MASLKLQLPSGVRARTAAGHQAAVNEAVLILRGPDSLWPVDTGRSKRAWRVIGSGWGATIFNPLRYASFVEKRGGWRHGRRTGPNPAKRTLRRNVKKLNKAALVGTALPGSIEAGSTRPDILSAFLARATIEADETLYSTYLAIAVRQNRRGLGIIRPLELLRRERAMRERAQR